MEYSEEIETYALPEDYTPSVHKLILKDIHTNSVSNCKENYSNNKVLNAPAPEINPEVTKLKRETCSTQLRSGYSKMLQSYLNRLDNSVPDICPKCNQSSHTIKHLFNCTNHPTDIEVISLWTRPIDAAKFLKLDVDPPT